MSDSMIIHFKMDEKTFSTPWPVAVDGDNTVTTGLGHDDGTNLLGFGYLGEQHILWMPDQIREDPARAVGLVPSFAGLHGAPPFEWQCVVTEVLLYKKKPVRS